VSARLTLAQARRLALGAQGLHRGRPNRTPTVDDLRAVVHRLGFVRIDSVSALVRAHYLPLFSRVGPYDVSLWDRLCHSEFPEAWCHAACFVPVDLLPALAFRRQIEGPQDPDLLDAVLNEITDRGPLAASELSQHVPQGGTWWEWSPAKRAVERLFQAGRLHVAERQGFERVYDLAERVHPSVAPDLDEHAGRSELLLRAAIALGVATDDDLADYHHQRLPKVRPLLRELVSSGQLEVVQVQGWSQDAYVVPGTAIPRRAEGAAHLGPFDNAVCWRPRVQRLWQMDLRLEIYVPEAKRIYGYYVLPFLLGDALVARVDLRADRKAGVLTVHAVHGEPGAPADTLPELAHEVRQMAGWLGMREIRVGNRGDLTPILADLL
jgi:uncharacterized protein YcaQ